jgi:hypothetical protein
MTRCCCFFRRKKHHLQNSVDAHVVLQDYGFSSIAISIDSAVFTNHVLDIKLAATCSSADVCVRNGL